MWIIFTEQCERITQVAHDNRATVIELLRSLTKNECLWVICSGCSPKMSKWGNHLFFRNKWFAQKTYEPISNPVIQYKTKCVLMLWLIYIIYENGIQQVKISIWTFNYVVIEHYICKDSLNCFLETIITFQLKINEAFLLECTQK